MGNTEKRKRKRINTETRTERRTRTKRRTRTRTKRKAASRRRQELPFHLGLLVEESFMREMNIKRSKLAWRKGKMYIKGSCPLRLASLLLRQRTQNLCRSWTGGSEMKRRVRKVSRGRDFQLSGKELKNQTGWASKFSEIWLTRKRTRRKDLITIRWTRRRSGVNILELMQYLPALLWQKAILKVFPDHWKKTLGRRERKNRNLRNDVMTNQERKIRIKKGKSRVMESRKTRKKRRKGKRKRRIKVSTRKAGKINQKTIIRTISLCVVTINFRLFPRKTVLVQPPRELPKSERTLKLMVSCMGVGRAASDVKAESKEHKLNGSIEGQPLFGVKAKASSVIPGADQIAEASKKSLFSVKARTSSVVPRADQIAETSKEPLFSVKAKATPIPGADQIAETSKEPLFNVKAKSSSVIPGADHVAEASKKPSFSVKAKASPVIPGADQIAETSKKPPHPDSKYLSQILSVPKVDDWSGYDDQEWLLSGSKRTRPKSAETCLDEVSQEHCVWSEALQIDSADVCALPYVIPY
ncbi:uncharacterized protein LOC107871283 isoform X2 [Capsicum annuum]|uniref:uncharacterized protein LOC107871283 isoform X2 n=1 Tax=Capsicum annuum TaxID=4072 RepID=UPI001FB0DF0F|nr:uncharacterized protein LOC107871283 isoform X2 [Capsicum annuum]